MRDLFWASTYIIIVLFFLLGYVYLDTGELLVSSLILFIIAMIGGHIATSCYSDDADNFFDVLIVFSLVGTAVAVLRFTARI